VIIPSVTPEEISKAILTLRGDNELLGRLRSNSRAASRTLNWDIESRKVHEVYAGLIKEHKEKEK
jgi:hypothetical protein